MQNLRVIIEKTNDGFSGYVSQEGIPVFAAAESISEVMDDIRLALKEINQNYESLDFDIDMRQFFEYYKVINKTELARIIGISPSNLRGYAANSKGAYISSDKIAEISKGINRLGRDLASLSLNK